MKKEIILEAIVDIVIIICASITRQWLLLILMIFPKYVSKDNE